MDSSIPETLPFAVEEAQEPFEVSDVGRIAGRVRALDKFGEPQPPQKLAWAASNPPAIRAV